MESDFREKIWSCFVLIYPSFCSGIELLTEIFTSLCSTNESFVVKVFFVFMFCYFVFFFCFFFVFFSFFLFSFQDISFHMWLSFFSF